VAAAVLAIFVVSYGSPIVTAIALPQIAQTFDNQRSIPALANSLVWLGSGAGGILMGPLAERFGPRATTIFGASMIALGFIVSAQGSAAALIFGHGVLVGVLGTGAVHAPLYIYISRWFDRRRGAALALVASGQYLGGAFWPTLMLSVTAASGWRSAMVLFGVLAVLTIVPIALLWVKAPPSVTRSSDLWGAAKGEISRRGRPFLYPALCFASVLCCIPMAMPPAHLPALCGDLGISPSTGAAMLSVLLGLGFVSRQVWGWLSDRIGGLATVAAASACQAGAIAGFLVADSEPALFAVAAGFGLGFSGIIPAYILAVREFFPEGDASWRVPVLFFCSLVGMAIGGWAAGAIYDQVGSYRPGFLIGLISNVANVALLLFLLIGSSKAVATPRDNA
jgi:MFS family permease